jgi:hypothetical protein
MKPQRKTSARLSTQHGDHIQPEPGAPAKNTRKRGRGVTEEPTESVEDPLLGSVGTPVGVPVDRNRDGHPHSGEEPVLQSVSNTISDSSVDPNGRNDGEGGGTSGSTDVTHADPSEVSEVNPSSERPVAGSVNDPGGTRPASSVVHRSESTSEVTLPSEVPQPPLVPPPPRLPETAVSLAGPPPQAPPSPPPPPPPRSLRAPRRVGDTGECHHSLTINQDMDVDDVNLLYDEESVVSMEISGDEMEPGGGGVPWMRISERHWVSHGHRHFGRRVPTPPRGEERMRRCAWRVQTPRRGEDPMKHRKEKRVQTLGVGADHVEVMPRAEERIETTSRGWYVGDGGVCSVMPEQCGVRSDESSHTDEV